MKVPFFTPKREYSKLKKEIQKSINNVLEHGLYILGPEVKNFENNLKQYMNVKRAVCVASGSDALFLSLKALGVKEGDEVITSPFTFFSTASAITRIGAKPVFVDIDPKTFNMDIDKIENNITNKTKAILPIHLFLQPAKMDKILQLSDKYNLKILEDAAEAFGMEYKKEKAGTIGDIGIYSFYPTKTLGAYGDGGAIVTDKDKYADEIISLRNHGQQNRYHHKEVGYNDRLDTFQGAVLNIKLKYIEKTINERNKAGKYYTNNLKEIERITTPTIIDNVTEVYYVYSILTDKRDELQNYLNKHNISTKIYYPIPLHMQECFQYLDYKEGDFPVSEEISRKILALPLFPGIKKQEIDYVIEKIKDFFT